MRIVQYYPRALSGNGGMTGAVRRLSQAFHDAGAQAVIAYDGGGCATPPNGGPQLVPVRHAGPATERLPVPSRLRAVFEGADLVVLNSAWAAHNVVAGAVARRAGVPYVVAPRGAYALSIVRRKRMVKRLWWLTLERRLVTRARAVHLFFASERPDLDRLNYRGDVLVAPNGIDVPRDVVWDGGSGGYILWLGRFDPQHKGIDMLVRAVELIEPSRRPQLWLRGPEWRGGRQRIRGMVEDLGLGRWVSVGEPVYGVDKWRTLSRAIGFAYPSRWEGFGNSLAEAAAIGLPSLVTPYPLGLLLAARNGAIVADPTASGLADGLRALTAAPAREVGANARRTIEAELSWDGVGRSWLEQAERLLSHAAPDPRLRPPAPARR